MSFSFAFLFPEYVLIFIMLSKNSEPISLLWLCCVFNLLLVLTVLQDLLSQKRKPSKPLFILLACPATQAECHHSSECRNDHLMTF